MFGSLETRMADAERNTRTIVLPILTEDPDYPVPGVPWLVSDGTTVQFRVKVGEKIWAATLVEAT